MVEAIHRTTFDAMASRCELRIGAPDAQAAERLAQQAIAEVRRIETKYSRYRPDSIVSRINAAAGGEAVRCDDETMSLMGYAAALHGASDGLFDITSGVLRRAWDFRQPKVPAAQVLQPLLALVGWSKVECGGQEVRLRQAGMEIDFGGFGKEYAADRAATLLQEHGVRRGMVNLGGDIRLVGPRPDGKPWLLAVQHPREANRLLAELPLSSGALATSGDYERYFEIDGNRYCHVLDPRTGWPVTMWRSISVVAPACLAAGALTTVAMLKGADALRYLDAQDVGYLAVDQEGRLHQRGAARPVD